MLKKIVYKDLEYVVSYIKYKIKKYSYTEFLLYIDTDKQSFIKRYSSLENAKSFIENNENKSVIIIG